MANEITAQPEWYKTGSLSAWAMAENPEPDDNNYEFANAFAQFVDEPLKPIHILQLEEFQAKLGPGGVNE